MYLYIPTTIDKEVDESVLFATAKDLAEHLYNVSLVFDLPVFDADKNKINGLESIEKDLNEGFDLFLGLGWDDLSARATNIELTTRGHHCFVFKFYNCDSVLINDDIFIKDVKCLSPDVVSTYLELNSGRERVDFLKSNGNVAVLNYEKESEKLFIALRDLALKKVNIEFFKTFNF